MPFTVAVLRDVQRRSACIYDAYEICMCVYGGERVAVLVYMCKCIYMNLCIYTYICMYIPFSLTVLRGVQRCTARICNVCEIYMCV